MEERSLGPDSTRVILDSITEGVFTVNPEFRITWFNRAAQEITGVPREEALGRPCWEVLRASVCEGACSLRESLRTGQPVSGRVVTILRGDGRSIPVAVSTAVLRDPEGRMLGGVETFRDLSVEVELRRRAEGRSIQGEMISGNPAMQELFALLPRVAESEAAVLIQGESGTGKELLARELHRLSPRREGPLVAVNCGALPDTLLESELFGHVAGAFTDARRDRLGRFAQAEGGTILLDEIGEISPAMQVRLLRVLQEGEYEPLGSSRTLRADVRVLAATNRDLAAEVEAGRFRQDLYYRIKVVELTLPPLRDRREDIPLLVESLLSRLQQSRRREIAGLSEEAMALLRRHPWPGNIRELANALEHAFVLCQGPLIQPEHLPPSLGGQARPAEALPEGISLEELEILAIRQALARSGGDRSAAARSLGIHRTTLYRKLKRYRLGPS